MRAAGLLGGGAGGGSGAAPVGFTDGAMPEEENPNVTPEEQQQYDAFVKNAMEIIYTPEGKVQPEVLQRLSTGSKPIDTLAQTTVWVVMMVEQDAKQNGMAIDDDVIYHAGSEVLEQLVDVADAAGLHTYKQAEQQGAWYQALDMYREANTGDGGRINEDEAKAAFEQLDAADKEGRADEVVPGFEQESERALAMAQEDQNEVEPDADEDDTKTLSARSVGRA